MSKTQDETVSPAELAIYEQWQQSVKAGRALLTERAKRELPDLLRQLEEEDNLYTAREIHGLVCAVDPRLDESRAGTVVGEFGSNLPSYRAFTEGENRLACCCHDIEGDLLRFCNGQLVVPGFIGRIKQFREKLPGLLDDAGMEGVVDRAQNVEGAGMQGAVEPAQHADGAKGLEIPFWERFSFETGRACFNDGELFLRDEVPLPGGLSFDVLWNLVKAEGRLVPYKDLHHASTESEASDELRKAKVNINKAFKHQDVLCKVKTTRTKGYRIVRI